MTLARQSRIVVAGFLMAVVGLASPYLVQAGQVAIVPPPEPAVRPLIGTQYPADADHNGLADALENRAAQATAQARAATLPAQQQAAQAALNTLVTVELVFTSQVTQPQINAFQALGGKIDYVYQTVSYGWNGQIPLGSVTALPAAMGPSLVFVDEPKRMVLHLDLATQTGRVRPVWAAGFAGSTGGISGDPSITIAIIDTGVDSSHTDLSGRQQFWKDYSSDGFTTPQDLIQHGSHVTGIALGAGDAGGSATGTLFYTDSGDLTGVPSGSFYPAPIGLPATSLTFSSTARWVGGGSTDLYLLRHAKGGGSFYAQSTSTYGTTGITETNTFTPLTTSVYTAGLLSNGAISQYVVTNSVTNYPGLGDGFNKLRGVAPGCRWAGAKVFTNAGSGLNSYTNAAIDELVSLRATHNVKVMNMSLGTIGNPGLDPTERQKVNTAVNNGIVMCISAGNDGGNSTDGQRQVDDPGRAAMALTVAASNDVNQLTSYTSVGFPSPGSTAGQEEDYKPDLMAPGGSTSYYTGILSVDSNTGDGPSFSDQQANDYTIMQGTSMASPFAAGCAALVIDAVQKSGTTWSFASGQHSKYVKMVLCATATESNTTRESNLFSPTLQRATAGPIGFPAGKDPYEGYGMINPDAAVEAVSLAYVAGETATATLGSNAVDRRAWARRVDLAGGAPFLASLTVPAGGDFDMYLYSTTPSNYGTPVLLASSTNAGNGLAESISYTPAAGEMDLLVIKRVSGSGAFTLNTPPIPGDYTHDGSVDGADLALFQSCVLGPAVVQANPGCTGMDFDLDNDVDQADFGIWQRCFTGTGKPGNPNCAN